MITDKDIARINELYHKSKAEGLTPAEKEEQMHLRGAYITAIRKNLRGSLESMKIQNPVRQYCRCEITAQTGKTGAVERDLPKNAV